MLSKIVLFSGALLAIGQAANVKEGVGTSQFKKPLCDLEPCTCNKKLAREKAHNNLKESRVFGQPGYLLVNGECWPTICDDLYYAEVEQVEVRGKNFPDPASVTKNGINGHTADEKKQQRCQRRISEEIARQADIKKGQKELTKIMPKVKKIQSDIKKLNKLKGEKGDRGSKGLRGTPGAAGGPRGPKGAKGAKGDRGKKGSFWRI